jgi:hypothetical protein
MRLFNFELPSSEDVIIVIAIIENKYKFRLALDTAATHTTIDSNVLFFSGYELKNSLGEFEIETANGIIVVERYILKQFESLSIIKSQFEVQVYDFIAHGVNSDYDGVIGLDFLKDHKITIDFIKNEIIIHF